MGWMVYRLIILDKNTSRFEWSLILISILHIISIWCVHGRCVVVLQVYALRWSWENVQFSLSRTLIIYLALFTFNSWILHRQLRIVIREWLLNLRHFAFFNCLSWNLSSPTVLAVSSNSIWRFIMKIRLICIVSIIMTLSITLIIKTTSIWPTK